MLLREWNMDEALSVRYEEGREDRDEEILDLIKKAIPYPILRTSSSNKPAEQLHSETIYDLSIPYTKKSISSCFFPAFKSALANSA